MSEETGSAYQYIRYETKGVLGLIVLTESALLLTRQAISELSRAFSTIQADPNIQTVILTGSSSKGFCLGYDHRLLLSLDPLAAKDFALEGQALTQHIERLGKPVIAAINGDAIGAGLELALACTLRLAAEQVSLGDNAIKLGLMPAFGGTVRLAKLIGRGRALELLLTGEMLSAEEALSQGLINRLCRTNELFREARELAQKISINSPLAIKYCLESVLGGAEMASEDAQFLEATLFGLCYASTDLKDRLEDKVVNSPDLQPARFQRK